MRLGSHHEVRNELRADLSSLPAPAELDMNGDRHSFRFKKILLSKGAGTSSLCALRSDIPKGPVDVHLTGDDLEGCEPHLMIHEAVPRHMAEDMGHPHRHAHQCGLHSEFVAM